MKTVVAALTSDIIVIGGITPQQMDQLMRYLDAEKREFADKYLFLSVADLDQVVTLPDVPIDVQEAAATVRVWLDQQ